MRSLTIANDISELRRASAWLVDSARELDIPAEVAADLEVCANEVLANIITYGYDPDPDAAGRYSVALQLSREPQRATLRIEDDSEPFDPLTHQLPAAVMRLEDAPIGGLGLMIIRKLAPDSEYARTAGRNVLTLHIPLGAAPDAAVRRRGADRRRAAGDPPPGVPERRLTGDRRRHSAVIGGALFAGLAWHAVEDAVARCPVRRLAPGEALLEAGQSNDKVYLLLSGRLQVQLVDGQQGAPIAIEPGGSIGELSSIDGKPVSAAVVADTESDVAVIGGDVFWNELIPVPGFARNVMRMLSERMRTTNERMVLQMRERLELEHLQKQLDIAREIQASMLPPRGALFPGRTEIELFGLMDAASDIGGDLYDAFMPDENRLVLVIGDVCGKGVPAALFMARVIGQLRSEAARVRRPESLLARLNAVLCANNEAGMFVTLLTAVLDLPTGVLSYSNAGHLPLAHARAGEPFSWLPLPKGLVAGMLETAAYQPAKAQLAPGDRVILYTDGVTEATDPDGAFFGDERVLDTLTGMAGASAEDAVLGLRGAVLDFARGAMQSDDLTLLALRYRP